MAVAALEQVGESGANRQADPVDVGQDHRAPVLRRLLEEAARGAEAGVGKYDVDAPEALDRCSGHRLDLAPLGDVAAHGKRSLLATKLGNKLLQRLQPPSRQNQPVLGGRSSRRRSTDTAGSSGNKQHWIVTHAPILSAQALARAWIGRVVGG